MKNLKNLRANRDITLNKLAADVGSSPQMLSYYELGKSNPPVEMILKIADYFDCSTDYLLGHQTSGILHLDSLTADQRKLIKLVMKMDADTTKYLVGYFSNLTDSPLEDITPRPIKKNPSQNWDENF